MQKIENGALLIISVFNFSLFCWGAFKYFSVRGSLSKANYRLIDVTTVITWLGNAFCLFWFPAIGPQVYIALVLQIFSTVLFFATKKAAAKAQLTVIFSEDKPSTLLNFGPYRWVRHPFYTSYLVSYFGAALGTTSFFPYLCAIAMLLIYIRASRFEEAKFSQSDLAAAYAEYRSKTGAFFPKIF